MGMHCFRDDSKQNAVTFAGNVLVIDVEFAIEQANAEKPLLKVAEIKTSHALDAGNSTNTSLSTQLDVFLAESLRSYCDEMQKQEEVRDSQRAATLRRRLIEYLRYLVLLDGLASKKDDGSIKWFTDLDELSPILVDVARSEAQSIAGSLKVTKAPLDIFLLRSHSLPLPYLTRPSLSFLVHISPATYLKLLRQLSPSLPGDIFPIDIPLSILKSNLKDSPKGVTMATIYLTQLSETNLYLPSVSMPNVMNRPTFPLHPPASEIDHAFHQLDSFNANIAPPGLSASASAAESPHTWVLDFTNGEKQKGVVMNQSRMKSIELVVNPLGDGSGLSAVSDVLSLGSWIDLLVSHLFHVVYWVDRCNHS